VSSFTSIVAWGGDEAAVSDVWTGLNCLPGYVIGVSIVKHRSDRDKIRFSSTLLNYYPAPL
jgi:hypothetical protein